jgi:hypothetical protein
MHKKEEEGVVWSVFFDLAKNMIPILLGVGLFYILFHLFQESIFGIVIYITAIAVGMMAFYIHQAHVNSEVRVRFVLNSLLVLMVTIFLYGQVYTLTAGDQAYMLDNGHRTTLDQATGLYFSTVTFTTLGYGDIVPMGYFRYVAMVEAFTGVILVGIFIYGLTRS